MNQRASCRTLERTLLGLCMLAMVVVPIRSTADDRLFQALGGIDGVSDITQAILDRIFADERIAAFFKDADRDVLHELIAEQICEESGGPCDYQGLSMQDAHDGLEIGHDEFDAFVEDVILGMEDAAVPFRLQNRVLKIFAPMRKDIVYR